MNEIQALILGIIQGLTEFLPVSSSGHLEIGHILFGITNKNNLLFAVVVHGATVLSTILIFWGDIVELAKEFSWRKWNSSTKYLTMLLFSSIPVIIVGLFFKDDIEAFYNGQMIIVGSMLIVTAILLTLTYFVKARKKEMTFAKSLLIGLAQTIAVLPGISRSGATIAAGLLLGVDRKDMARFSFLMVLIPIIGAFSYDILKGEFTGLDNNTGILQLSIGFIAAFISGLFACKWMIEIVKKGKLIYFAIYCFIIGLIAIFAA